MMESKVVEKNVCDIKVLEKIVCDIKEETYVLKEDTNLIEDIGMDSLQMINFILQIEDNFNMEINFDELDYTLFQNCGELLSFITSGANDNEK